MKLVYNITFKSYHVINYWPITKVMESKTYTEKLMWMYQCYFRLTQIIQF